MSVSMRALFTGGQSPGPLLANLHGLLDDLIEHRGILAHGPKPRVRRRLGGGRLLDFLDLPKRLAHHLVLGGEAPGAYLVMDEALQVFGQMDFHGGVPASSLSPVRLGAIVAGFQLTAEGPSLAKPGG